MSKRRNPAAVFLASMVMGLLASAAFAGAASALPSWHFGGMPLSGSETIEAKATSASLSFAGLTTTCEPFILELKVNNTAGTGTGIVTGVPFSNCVTNTKACSVESIQAEALPWASSLTTVPSEHYLIIKGIKLVIFYSGPECALSELEIPITGSAGGLVDDLSETVTFSPSTFAATKTELKVFGTKVEWNGVFHLAATGASSGLAVTVL
jgi:hypothetical protein